MQQRAVRRNQAESSICAANIADKPGCRAIRAGHSASRPFHILVRSTVTQVAILHRLIHRKMLAPSEVFMTGVDIAAAHLKLCSAVSIVDDGPAARLLGVSSLNSGRVPHGPFFFQ